MRTRLNSLVPVLRTYHKVINLYPFMGMFANLELGWIECEAGRHEQRRKQLYEI
jgi:hypothetical protein